MKMLMDILIFFKSSFKIFWPVGGTRVTISLMVKAWRWAREIPHDCISYWKQHSVFFSHLTVIWNTVGNLNAAQLLWKLFSFSIALPAERSHTGKGPSLIAFIFVSCPHSQQRDIMEVRALCFKLCKCLFPQKTFFLCTDYEIL